MPSGRFAAHRALPRSPWSPWPSESAPTPPSSASCMRRCSVRCRCATRRALVAIHAYNPKFNIPPIQPSLQRLWRLERTGARIRIDGGVVDRCCRTRQAEKTPHWRVTASFFPDPRNPAGDRPRLHPGGRSARRAEYRADRATNSGARAFGRDPAVAARRSSWMAERYIVIGRDAARLRRSTESPPRSIRPMRTGSRVEAAIFR